MRHGPQPMRTKGADEFGTIPPLGYRLRLSYPDRWIRIYSLPEGKRYAETDEEREILLERQNAVASFVLGGGAACLVFSCEYDRPVDASVSPEIANTSSLEFAELWKVRELVDPSDPTDVPETATSVFGVERAWSADAS